MGFDVGDPLPLNFQLPDVTMTDKFPLAYLRRADGTAITGSPVSLVHSARGYYYASFTMPNVTSLVAQYVSYDDSGHTTVTDGVSPGNERFDKNPSSSSSGAVYVGQVTGIVEGDDALQTAEIVRGEDKTLYVRILNPNGTPYDLTDNSTAFVKLRNSDGTLLTKAAAIEGNPVLGTLSVVLLTTDTEPLEAALLTTLEVQLTRDSLLTIVEIRRAVNVVDPLG